MYKNILVTLETTATDRAIIDHVKRLAKEMGSTVILLHVATGVQAQWSGSEAGGAEIEADKTYLANVRSELADTGIPTRAVLLFGDPVREIVNWVNQNECDLIAMSTHGHRVVADIVLGATATRVQHNVSVPVLMLRAK